MYFHPDSAWLIARKRQAECNPHAAINRYEIGAQVRARRAEAAARRRFYLRYRLRSMAYRLLPGLARRLAL